MRNYSTGQSEFIGDSGIDIYASFHEIPIIIQCKCFQKAISAGIVKELKGILTPDQVGCVVSKNGFTKSAILYAENESQIILASENDICNKIRNYYFHCNRVISRKNQEFSNLDFCLEDEEFNLGDCISLSGKGRSTIKIGKLIIYK